MSDANDFCRQCHRPTNGVIVRIKGKCYCAVCAAKWYGCGDD